MWLAVRAVVLVALVGAAVGTNGQPPCMCPEPEVGYLSLKKSDATFSQLGVHGFGIINRITRSTKKLKGKFYGEDGKLKDRAEVFITSDALLVNIAPRKKRCVSEVHLYADKFSTITRLDGSQTLDKEEYNLQLESIPDIAATKKNPLLVCSKFLCGDFDRGCDGNAYFVLRASFCERR
mmetsp:Transcript_13090/g.40321  ORF Transcript_13090/g.40321 Transcript_13090/m.40321 type:complete len:179 (+) Transcript_13090:245-781(+)